MGYDSAMYSRTISIADMREAAEGGDPHAAFHLGWLYYIGNGVVPDKVEARKWYDRAANLGVREAAEICGILDAEAQRDQEGRTLRETILSSPKRVPVLLMGVFAVLVMIGLIAVAAYVFGGQTDRGKTETVAGEGTASRDEALRVVNRSSDRSEKQTTITREKASSEDAHTASVGEHGPDAVLETHGNANTMMAIESEMQPREPTAPQQSPRTFIDFNGWAERARKWLEDGNDVYTPDNHDKRPDKKPRQG